MTDRGEPTPKDATGVADLPDQERLDQDRLNQGIETLLYELIDHALPPYLREDLRIHKPLRRKTRDNLGRIIEINQESYRSPTLPDTYIRNRLTFSVKSGDFEGDIETFGLVDYGDGPPLDIPDSLTRAQFTGVNTLEDLGEVRKSLISQGLLPPPEPQTTEVNPLATTIASGLTREGVEVWVDPSPGYWLDERLEQLLPPGQSL